MTEKKTNEGKTFTPWDQNPTRTYLKTLVSSYYDMQKPMLGAKQRVIRSLSRAVREEVEEAALRGDTVGSQLTLPRKRKMGDFAPVDLTPAQLLSLDKLAGVAEKHMGEYMKEIARTLPSFGSLWDWLNAQYGIGPAMGGFLIANYDPYRAPRPSSYWQFSGLGELCTCDKKSRPHSVHRMKGRKNPYNSQARVKLLGVMAPGILKACIRKAGGDNDEKYEGKPEWNLMNTVAGQRWVRGPYAEAYWNYRHRLATRPDKNTNWGSPKKGDPKTLVGADAHMTAAAERYMIKQFLLDFWKECREYEGLPIVAPYHEAMRGYGHKAEAMA